MQEQKRIVFLDWLRVIACFMVMVIHSCEPFYLGGEAPNVTAIANRWDAFWISFVAASLVSLALGKIPRIGRWIVG